MSRLAAGDSYGFDLLSLKSEDDDDLPNFRLYARAEDDTRFPGNGGGSNTTGEYDPYSHSHPVAQAPQRVGRFPSYTTGSDNAMFGNADQLPIPQASSPIGYGGDMSFSTQYYSPPQSDNPTLHFNYSQEHLRGPSRSWESASSSYLNQEYEYGPYRQTSAAYSQGNFSSSSSSSSRNSYDSLPETHYFAEQNKRVETIERVREMNNIPPNVPVNLNALPDPPPGVRPTQKLASLVQLAIVGAPNQQLSLREIYAAIEERFTYFRTGDKKWQGSIRHMLSLKGEFVSVARPMSHPGSGNYWTLNMAATGEDKRARKRRPRGSRGGDKPARGASTDSQGNEDNDNDNDEAPVSPTGSQGSSISSRATTSNAMNRHQPYLTPSPHLTRHFIRRSESDSHLSQPQLESLQTTASQPPTHGMHSSYIKSPPTQGPYRGTYSSHHTYLQNTYSSSSYGSADTNADFLPNSPAFPLPATRYPLIPAPAPSAAGALDSSLSLSDDDHSISLSHRIQTRPPRTIINPLMAEGSRRPSSRTSGTPKNTPKDSKDPKKDEQFDQTI